MKIVCCAGVGGTGKTEVIKALAGRIPGAVVLPSVAREYYAMQGIENETAYLENVPPERRFRFQYGMLQHYMVSLQTRLAELPADTCVALMDRSVYDHMAYAICADINMSFAEYDAIMAFGSMFTKFGAAVYYFPYPASWIREREADDGFRSGKVGRDLMINAVLLQLLQTFEGMNYQFMSFADIQSRAALILHDLAIEGATL